MTLIIAVHQDLIQISGKLSLKKRSMFSVIGFPNVTNFHALSQR